MKVSFQFIIEDTVLVKCKTIYSERDPSTAKQTIEPEWTDLVVPEGITIIGKEAFWFIDHVCHIILPEGVKEIGPYAFYRCSLERITLPSSLQKIAGDAFLRCSNLKMIQISDIASWCRIEFRSVYGHTFFKSINRAAFYIHDKPMEDLIIPADTDFVSSCVFKGYEKLRSVRIEEGVRSIYPSAFSECTALESASLPDSVTFLGSSVFRECESLREVRLSSMVQEIPEYLFFQCKQLSSITIPDAVKTIGKLAFAGCTSLCKITIGDTVQIKDLNVFVDCPIDPAMFPKSYQERYCSIYTVCEEDVSELKCSCGETVRCFRKEEYDLSTARKIRNDAFGWRLHRIIEDDDAAPIYPIKTSEEKILELMRNRGGNPLDQETIYVKDGYFGGFLYEAQYNGDINRFVSLSGQCMPVMYECDSSIHGYDHSYTTTIEDWAFPLETE